VTRRSRIIIKAYCEKLVVLEKKTEGEPNPSDLAARG